MVISEGRSSKQSELRPKLRVTDLDLERFGGNFRGEMRGVLEAYADSFKKLALPQSNKKTCETYIISKTDTKEERRMLCIAAT